MALGGGGIKGVAHIGVLKRLEQEDIQISAISGTSAGGIAGALYASGFTADHMEDIMTNFDQSRLFSRNTEDHPALLGIQGLVEILHGIFLDRTFESLRIPFACTAVDIRSGIEIILDKGKIIDAVIATSAVPGVFPPKEYNNMLLVDGGVLDPVPITVVKKLAPGIPVVAVCLSKSAEENENFQPFRIPFDSHIPQILFDRFAQLRIARAFNIFVRSMDISSRLLTELQIQLDPPDVIIRPDVEKYSMLDKVDPKILIEIGYSAADEAIPQILKMFSWTDRIERQANKVWTSFRKSI